MRKKRFLILFILAVFFISGSFQLGGFTIDISWYVMHGGPFFFFTPTWNTGIVISAGGDIYTSGNSISWDTALFGFPQFDLNGIFGDAFVAKWSSKGKLRWYTFLGGPSYDPSYGIDIDKFDNVYVSGGSQYAWDETKYGAPLIAHHSSIGSSDGWVAKLDKTGNLIWYTFLGGDEYDFCTAIKVSPQGNVFVAGTSDGEWDTGDFGDPELAYNGDYDADIFVSKLNTNGVPQWYTFLGSDDWEYTYSLSVTPGENVFVGAEGILYWPQGKYGLPLYDKQVDDFYDGILAKLNSSGQFQWYTFMGEENDVIPFSMDHSRSGNLFLTGMVYSEPILINSTSTSSASFRNSRNRGSSISSTFLNKSTVYGFPHFDTFVSSFSFNGEKRWFKKINIGTSSMGGSIDVGPDEFVYVTGGATVNLPAIPLDSTQDVLPFELNQFAYLLKMSQSGYIKWKEKFDNTYFGFGTGVAVGDFGVIYLSGETLGLFFISSLSTENANVDPFPNQGLFILRLDQFYKVIADEKTDGGTIESEEYSVRPTDKCMINIYPDPGYEIEKIIDNEQLVETVNPYVIVNVNEDHFVDVYFRLIKYPPELILTGVRTSDSAWIIKKEFADLTATIVEHPTSPMDVKAYNIYKYVNGEWKIITSYTGPGTYKFADKSLTPGVEAKYILKAIAPDGSVVVESDILIL